jgi:hypothetical protein
MKALLLKVKLEVMERSQSQSYLMADGQSASLSWYQATI